MTTLEQRVEALEAEVAALKQQHKPKSKLLEARPPLTPSQEKMADEIDAIGRYWRRTNRMPPDDWKPGDPIPEPDWDNE